MTEYALISTWDKTGVESLATALLDSGFKLLATGGSFQFLKDKGFVVTEISEFTGEPERFEGRLKTLHHKVLGGILLRPGSDEPEWPYDFRIGAVVCNFYPFSQKASEISDLSKLMPWVDIGGPNMVRAAAKNFEHVWVFTKPDQYTRFIASPERNISLRARLALEAFEEVAHYNQCVADEFARVQLKEMSELKYGENPQQKARFFPNRKLGPKFLGDWSYNNIRDAEAAFRFVKVWNRPACSVVKHQTLCGAAVSVNSVQDQSDLENVFQGAWEGDEVSRFGGVIGLNFDLPEKVQNILEAKFVEVLVLPKTAVNENWATQVVSKKEKLKILLLDAQSFGEKALQVQNEVITGVLGRLEQEIDLPDKAFLDQQIPLEEKLLQFGEWTAACSKSNAITLCGIWNQTCVLAGAGQGQPNRIDSLEKLAMARAKDFSKRFDMALKDLICFSDGFLPFDDLIKILAKEGIKKLVQPGGSKNDLKNESTARELGLDMKIRPPRHFWH